MPLRLSSLALALFVALPSPCISQDTPRSDAGESRAQKDVDAMLSAIVRVNMRAMKGARSAGNLGAEREGTGVVIDEGGHILTIGYIVIEAASIEVTTQANKAVPATLAAYDHASGFALLRAGAPMGDVTPLPLGSADALALREPVVVLPHGGRESASVVHVVSKRKFTASWEYLLESAIFTSPPSMHWAGAALVNREGKLVGIGSLLLRAVDPAQALPGNMFVPVDVLKPILADLIAKGRRSGPARPWLGLGTEEIQGRLIVANVSSGGPAEQAGIRRGDIVLGVGADAVGGHEEFYRKLWSLGPAGIEIPLKILQGTELKDFKVRSIDRFQYFREKPAG
jgi:S1-C subfamily serine protease